MNNKKIKLCIRNCGYYIVYLGKDHDKRGSTGFYEIDQTRVNDKDYLDSVNSVADALPNIIPKMQEHTYHRCDKLIRNNLEKQKARDEGQTKLF